MGAPSASSASWLILGMRDDPPEKAGRPVNSPPHSGSRREEVVSPWLRHLPAEETSGELCFFRTEGAADNSPG